MDMKKEYGLTNHQIAEGLERLSDDDFYEVFVELADIYGVKKERIGKFIQEALAEIASNVDENYEHSI